jgi:uncharacterized membrane protein YfcA
MKTAIGTSLLIIAAKSATGFLGYLESSRLWIGNLALSFSLGRQPRHPDRGLSQ